MNPKAHYLTLKCPPPVPILSQLVPVHTPTSHFLKLHVYIILPPTPGSPKLFPLGFPTKTLYTPLLSPVRATCPANLIILYLITRTILGEQNRSLSSFLCSFLNFPVISSLSSPNTLLNTLFPTTHGVCSSLSVSNQVSYPYKKTSTLIVLYLNL